MNYDSNELILHDVRCFQGEQHGRCKPITLLVGENSTGKTTFLSCYSVLHRLFAAERRNLDQQLDFNEEPFSMGSFRNIASSNHKSNEPVDNFKIGLAVSSKERIGVPPCHLTATFSEQGSQPVLSSLHFQFDEHSFLEMRRSDTDSTIMVIPGFQEQVNLAFSGSMDLLDFLVTVGASEKSLATVKIFTDLRPFSDYLDNLFDEYDSPTRDNEHRNRFGDWFPNFSNLIPVAPLRSKPKRTYDPIRETRSPEGEHIPMLMMRLARTDQYNWESLHNRLVKFGSESGLFSDIDVKYHDRQMSDPFQLEVNVRSGLPTNIMDVGYGVSQSLPILVDVLTTEDEFSQNNGKICTFLLQQPEVHLHPRAQAELASLFVESYTKCSNRFLIETHSDYFIDRFRIAVRKGILDADSVSVLYFEPNANGVTIRNMSLDENGNLMDVPDGYRSFFEMEADTLLGFNE